MGRAKHSVKKSTNESRNIEITPHYGSINMITTTISGQNTDETAVKLLICVNLLLSGVVCVLFNN